MRISYKLGRILPSYVQQTNVIMTLFGLQSVKHLSDGLIPQHSPNRTRKIIHEYCHMG